MNDEILADEEMNRFSLEPRNQNSIQRSTKFDLCSDRLRTKYPDYELDSRCRIVPGLRAPLRNFTELKQMLLSKDLTKDVKYNKDDLLFLDGKVDMTGNAVAF